MADDVNINTAPAPAAPVAQKETIVVEKGSAGGVIAAIALLIAVVAVLYFLGMLPI